MSELNYQPALERPDLLAEPVLAALQAMDPADAAQVQVAEIDPDLADTEKMSEAYGFSLDMSANCVIVSGKRSGEQRDAAVVVLGSDRADINNVVRRHLDVRKISFAPMDFAVEQTGMAYGGICPVGLPDGWKLLVDEKVLSQDRVIIGSGIRGSKLFLPGELVGRLPNAEELALAFSSAG